MQFECVGQWACQKWQCQIYSLCLPILCLSRNYMIYYIDFMDSTRTRNKSRPSNRWERPDPDSQNWLGEVYDLKSIPALSKGGIALMLMPLNLPRGRPGMLNVSLAHLDRRTACIVNIDSFVWYILGGINPQDICLYTMFLNSQANSSDLRYRIVNGNLHRVIHINSSSIFMTILALTSTNSIWSWLASTKFT